MIILADSGSTKCDWTIVDEDNSVFKSFRTIGLNPLILSRNQVVKHHTWQFVNQFYLFKNPHKSA